MSFPSHFEISRMTTDASQLQGAAWLFNAVAYTSVSEVQRSFTPFGSESKSSGPLKPPASYRSITQNLVPKKSHDCFPHAEAASACSQPDYIFCSLLILRLLYSHGRHSVLWLHGHHGRRLSKPCPRLASDSIGCSFFSGLVTSWGLCLHFELLGHSSPISGDF